MILNEQTLLHENSEMEGRYFLAIKIINKFMRHGKKTIIEFFFLKIRQHIKTIWSYFPRKSFSWIFEHIKPILGLFPKRQGKMYNFIPTPLQNNRPIIVALKWFVQNVKAKSIPRPLRDRIIYELAYIIFNSRYSIVQRRNTHYAVVYDNRANSRFRWK